MDILKLPTDKEIEAEAETYSHEMTSMHEGIYMPLGFIEGAKWMKEKIKSYAETSI